MNTIPIFDGHNDTLAACLSPEKGEPRSFFEWSETGQMDLPRAKAGGMKGGIFAIFTPPPPDSPDRDMMSGVTFTELGYEVSPRMPVEYAYARDFSERVIGYAQRLERESNGQVVLARNDADLERGFNGDGLALVLHLEGAEAIAAGTVVEDLERYYDAGVRSLGLVWSRPNAFGEGVPFRYPGSPDTGGGLTEAGKRLVHECSRMGILVDLAHLNERGFWDAAKVSDRPLVVSHTAVHAICQSTRNLTDQQIDAVGRSGGIVGIMFEPMNIMPDGKPNPQMALSELARHIDYVARRIGVDHVGFGSDFDGADMPEALRDASKYQDLIQALREMGYQGEDLEKIAYQNWMRVLKESWD